MTRQFLRLRMRNFQVLSSHELEQIGWFLNLDQYTSNDISSKYLACKYADESTMY